MRRAIGKYSRDFVAIILLIILAALVGGYILSQQRLQLPFITEPQCTYKAQFTTAQAVTPGQGQTVRVSGVQIGDIGSVNLSNGIATVKMSIDHQYCNNLIHQDASALLRPKTGLNDIFIELNPGSRSTPIEKAGFTIPVANTLPNVNPDQFLSAIDQDTRDYLTLLIGGAGQGLYNRGHALQAVFEKFLPTHQDLARLNAAVATRHAELARLIHSLNLLNTALAQRGPEISQLVRSSAVVFRAFASQQAALQRSLQLLPPTLALTTQTLGKVQTFAEVLGPTAENLRPVVRAITPANKALIPLARRTTPILATQIRPFVRDSRPLVRSLQPAAISLNRATPNLTNSFVVLNHLFNLLGYNKSGPQDSLTDPNRQEGFLFWLAWVNHNAASVFGNSDANSTFRYLTNTASCQTIAEQLNGIPGVPPSAVAALTGLINVVGPGSVCPNA